MICIIYPGYTTAWCFDPPMQWGIFIHSTIHTYMHTYICTYIHTYVRTYVHTYIHACILTKYVHVYIHQCLNSEQIFYFAKTKWTLISSSKKNGATYVCTHAFTTKNCLDKFILIRHVRKLLTTKNQIL